MTLDYFFFYMESNIVCIVVLAILLINDKLHSSQQENQIWFNRTLIAHILYFTSDIFWAAELSGQLPPSRLLVGLFNLLNYILLSLLAYEWFMYMAVSEDMPLRKSRRQRILWLLPMFVSVTVMIIAYLVAPTFWISESGELNSWYYPLMIAAPIIYLLSAFIFSVINSRKTESRDKKRLFLLIGIYPLGVLSFGLIQTFMLEGPLFCFGCTIMMTFFYIHSMQALISVDSLTRLNNRGQINRYMEQLRFRENIQLYVMMIDIDRFKEINDTCGHAEGDRALILVAEALRKVCGRVNCPIFLGRYGGDEFTVFIQNPEDGDLPEQVAEIIRSAIAEKQQENHLLYNLQVSIGFDALQGRNDTVEACLVRADEKLYEDKRSRGNLR